MRIERFRKFGAAYGLVLAIIWTFDYLYMPWLGITFKYLTIIPLFFSLLLVCWVGLYLYDYLKEDVFFIGKIKPWLEAKSSWKLIDKIKQKIRQSPKATFVFISAFWSPLHGYLFFRTEDKYKSNAFIKIGEGSIYCAIFWGIVVSMLVFIWEFIRKLLT